jgi:hypothetical protein
MPSHLQILGLLPEANRLFILNGFNLRRGYTRYSARILWVLSESGSSLQNFQLNSGLELETSISSRDVTIQLCAGPFAKWISNANIE